MLFKANMCFKHSWKTKRKHENTTEKQRKTYQKINNQTYILFVFFKKRKERKNKKETKKNKTLKHSNTT